MEVNAFSYNPFVYGFCYFDFKAWTFRVRLRFDNNKRESAMRAVTSGASALNHTIKNEIGKIDILLIGLSMKLNGKTRSRL